MTTESPLVGLSKALGALGVPHRITDEPSLARWNQPEPAIQISGTDFAVFREDFGYELVRIRLEGVRFVVYALGVFHGSSDHQTAKLLQKQLVAEAPFAEWADHAVNPKWRIAEIKSGEGLVHHLLLNDPVNDEDVYGGMLCAADGTMLAGTGAPAGLTLAQAKKWAKVWGLCALGTI